MELMVAATMVKLITAVEIRESHVDISCIKATVERTLSSVENEWWVTVFSDTS